jgi:hypothetical protein
LRERVLRAGVVVLAVSMPLASGLVAQGLVSGQLGFRTLAYLSASRTSP